MKNVQNNASYEHIDFSEITKVRFSTLAEKGNYVPSHWHQSIEFIYVLEGERTLTVENRTFLLTKGNFSLINANAIHSTKHPIGTIILVLQIPLDFLEQFIPEIKQVMFVLENSQTITNKQREIQKIKDLLNKMKAIDDKKETGFLLQFNSLLFELLFELYKNFSVKTLDINSERKNKDLQRLDNVLKYINKYYTRTITLEEIAQIAFFQPSYFCRFFKKHMGVTFIEYQNQLRLSYIYRDLINTKDTLNSILEKHGFSNYKLFRQMFKKHFKDTPMKIRQKIKQENFS